MNTRVNVKKMKALPGLIFAALLLSAIVVCIGLLYRTYDPKTSGTETVDDPMRSMISTDEIPEWIPVRGAREIIEEGGYTGMSIPVNESIFKQPSVKEDVINVLIIGTDVEDNDKETGRSDTMVLLTYNRETKKVHLTSLLRDIWILIPNHGWNRLNAAYAKGGADLLIDTVNENFGLDVHDYVLIDFKGLVSIVDILGGVEVRLSEADIRRINRSMKLDEDKLPEADGSYLINGRQALVLCRNRSTSNGDFDRSKTQRDMMLALFDRVKSERRLMKITELLITAALHVKTNIKINTIIELGLEAIAIDDLSVEQSSVPFDETWKYASIDGKSVIVIDLAHNREALQNELYR